MTSPSVDNPIVIRLDEMLRHAVEAPQEILFDGSGFRRSRQQVDCGAGVETELLSDASSIHRITVVHVRLRIRQGSLVRVLLDNARKAEPRRGYLAPHPIGGTIWLPSAPVARHYDRFMRIQSETQGRLDFSHRSGTLEMTVRVEDGQALDIPFAHGQSNGEQFENEIIATGPIERLRLYQDDWYDVQDVAQVWNYLIYGRIHDPRWEATRTRIECQQCAHAWYSHLTYLYQHTGKRLYGALRDIIAHSVLLSLPSDRRWRHGSWSDEMETHTRFQTDGIHLLLSHFQQCGQPGFLDAACGAADYLIQISDALDAGNAWYVHDTLELGDDPGRSGYPAHLRSRAFGKHPGNTLCLNTHVWTLSALRRLATVCHSERRVAYEQALARGMNTLQVVLTASTGEALYRILYAVRDVCLRWHARTGATMPLKICDAFLRRALRRLKPRLARIAMPNGYIERDLERTTLSDRYIPVNLKDLALLARVTGSAWLRPYVERGLSQWLNSGLADKEIGRSPTAQQSLDAALLLAADDAIHVDLARRILSTIHAAGRAISLDAIAGTAGDTDATLSHLMPDSMDRIIHSVAPDSLHHR